MGSYLISGFNRISFFVFLSFFVLVLSKHKTKDQILCRKFIKA